MPTITTVTDVSLSFPILPEPCIGRAHNLQTINQMFQSGARVVVVSGEADIGKTTTLAQFAIDKRNTVLCFFLRAISDLGYDPTQLRFDLCNQIQFILEGIPLDSSVVPSQSDARQALLRLVRHARQIRSSLYFVVDGLADIPDTNAEALQWFRDILPLNMESFRILLSGDLERLPDWVRAAAGLKPFVLGGFTADEQRQALVDCALTDQDLTQLCRYCNGSPGITQSVRRLLKQGHEPRAILDLESDEARNLFRIEWKKFQTGDERQVVVLTLLAYFPNRSTDQSISDLTGYLPADVRSAVQHLSFVRQDKESGSMMIASESVRRFAQVMLEPHKSRALDVVIKNLRSKPSTSQVTVLPEFLHHRGEWQALLEFFDATKLALLVSESRSVGAATIKTATVADVAKSIGDWANAIRFQVFGTTLRSILETPAPMEELNFALADDDIDAGLSIATTNPNAEIRLKHFSALAKHQFVRDGRISPEIGEEIERLSKIVDAQQLGEEGLSIAYDLLLVAPSVSAALISGIAGTGNVGNSLDAAISKLSQRALRDEFTHELRGVTLRAIADIARPSGSGHSDLLSELFSKSPDADRIYDASRRIPSGSDRVWLIRAWLMENCARADAVRLSLRVCKEIIGDPVYSPNAGVFVDLARPLIESPRDSLSPELAGLLRSQVPSVNSIGPTVDAYRLREILTTYEHCIDSPSARSDFDDLVLGTEEIREPSVRATVLAGLYGRRDTKDRNGKAFIENYGATSYVLNELRSEISKLLLGTFEHDVVLSNVLAGLSYGDWKEIKEIVDQINTASRRDAALVGVVRSLCRHLLKDASVREVWLKKTSLVLSAISALESSDLARHEVAISVCRKVPILEASDLDGLEGIVRSIHSAPLRARAIAHLLGACPDDLNRTRVEGLREMMLSAVQATDGERERSTTILYCYVELTKSSPALARELKEACAARLLGSGTPNGMYWAAFANLSRLAIKVYVPLEVGGVVSELDRRRFESALDGIEPLAIKLELWVVTALAMRAAACDRHNIIWVTKIQPLLGRLESFKTSDTRFWSRVVVGAFPLAWCMNQAAAKAMLVEIPIEYQERAVDAAVQFIARKRIPGEAFDAAPDTVWPLTRTKIDELIELGGLTKSDEVVHDVTTLVLRFLGSAQGKSECTQNSRDEYLRRVEKLFTAQLPSVDRHIKHDGYLILCKAEVCRYKKVDGREWGRILDEASNLPNLADRILVLTMLSRTIPANLKALRERAYDAADSGLGAMTSVEDRLNRAMSLCEIAPADLGDRVKATSIRAFEYLKDIPEDRYEDAVREYIDSVYNFDPAVAESMAALLENDPARRYAKQVANEQLEIKKQATSNGLLKIGATDVRASIRQTNEACWRQLGKVNASGASPLGAAAVEQLFATASKASFRDSYGVLSLAVLSSAAMFRSATHAREKILPIFHALLDAQELSGQVVPLLMSNGNVHSTSRVTETTDRYSKMVEPGQRAEALATVARWLSDLQPSLVSICDPYIEDIEDLDAVRLVLDAVPDASVELLVGFPFRSFLEKMRYNEETLVRVLSDRWGQEKVPYIRIVSGVVANSIRSPVHDRWWITDKGVIEMGTSFSGIGIERSSKIRLVPLDEVNDEVRLVSEMLKGQRRQHRGEWISYLAYTLLPPGTT